MAVQVDWSRLAEGAVVPLILGLLGWWAGFRTRSDRLKTQYRGQQDKAVAASDNRALREMDIVREEWNSTKIWWTAELKEARAGEDRCERKYNKLQRWAVGLAGKWNAHHPDDPCELPDGNGDSR